VVHVKVNNGDFADAAVAAARGHGVRGADRGVAEEAEAVG